MSFTYLKKSVDGVLRINHYHNYAQRQQKMGALGTSKFIFYFTLLEVTFWTKFIKSRLSVIFTEKKLVLFHKDLYLKSVF